MRRDLAHIKIIYEHLKLNDDFVTISDHVRCNKLFSDDLKCALKAVAHVKRDLTARVVFYFFILLFLF